MITADGKVYIKRYMAGYVPRIAESIALGTGGKAEALNDIALEFETDRVDIMLTGFDFVNNQVVFKAEIPETFAGIIYELGLFSAKVNTLNTAFGSRLILSFDSDSESWTDPDAAVDATFSATNARIGPDALVLAPAASTTKRVRLDGMYMDLSGYSNADTFVLAHHTTTNTSNIVIRFMSDLSNYYTLTIPGTGSGYKVTSVSKSGAVVTGTPSWDSINFIEIAATATAGGTATVTLDGLRVEDTDTPNPDYVMVSRELLATPITKEAGRSQTVEFALNVTV